ncbi:MAG: hypothetical protein IVW54_06055 [Candidatus Binataceae bacterium]|nr:hypothetical protein [Candidatus Binataceae bacterium]
MRMMIPPVRQRREIDCNLSMFFRLHRRSAFNRAVSDLCRFYGVRRPRFEWFEYIDWGKTAGKTYEDGRIHLVHPENWKRGRIYNKERMWIQMIYHEMGHYLLWVDAERKADAFMRHMVIGLRRPGRPVTAASAQRQTARMHRPHDRNRRRGSNPPSRVRRRVARAS